MPTSTSKAVLAAKYQATPVTLSDGSTAYLLLDDKGRLITSPIGFCQENMPHTLEMAHTVPAIGVEAYNLRMAHSRGLKSIAITNPGLAYANGTNALCLGAPVVETNELELESIYLSTKVAGDFFIVCDDLDIAPGATTTNTFDLIGINGDDVTNTCDVVWAAMYGNTAKGATGGGFHFDITPGQELYLIAPDIDYNLVVTYIEEYVEP